MEINYDFVKSISSNLESCNGIVRDSYYSSWDDSVHDSFLEFIDLFKRFTDEMCDSVSNISSVLSPLKAVNAQALKQECSSLISAIEGD